MSALIEELVSALRCLPGVGPKSAQRMALYLLERNRDGGRRLAGALTRAMDEVDHCSRCRTFSETEVCALCANQKRDSSLLCIVETPADVAAIERGAGYGGLYFVLMGHLSPLDGVGPEELGLHSLARRLELVPDDASEADLAILDRQLQSEHAIVAAEPERVVHVDSSLPLDPTALINALDLPG